MVGAGAGEADGKPHAKNTAAHRQRNFPRMIMRKSSVRKPKVASRGEQGIKRHEVLRPGQFERDVLFQAIGVAQTQFFDHVGVFPGCQEGEARPQSQYGTFH
jgi:hypothetical protein